MLCIVRFRADLKIFRNKNYKIYRILYGIDRCKFS